MNNNTKLCWDCQTVLPKDAFNNNTSRCKPCKKKYSWDYNRVDFVCTCGVTMRQNNKSRHLKSKAHLQMVAGQQKIKE